MTWEKGRQLKSFDSNTYTYNANGIRTSKTVNRVTHTYTLDGSKILREVWSDKTLIPLYDNEDSVCGIIYNGTAYYFYKNLQGDVIAITDDSGSVKVRYTYDAWGKVLSVTGELSGTIGAVNPFRYRSYYYDSETGFYYLQSRYYNPTVGRFVNTDKYISVLCQEILLLNINIYCENNPVDNIDHTGNVAIDSMWIALPIDIIMTLALPYVAGTYDVIGKGLEWSFKFISKTTKVAKLWKFIQKLLTGAVPKMVGVFSKFFILIRTAIWRITGSIIANSVTTGIGRIITRVATGIKNDLKKLFLFISMFFSFGSAIAGILDIITDGELDGYIVF